MNENKTWVIMGDGGLDNTLPLSSLGDLMAQ